MARRRSTSPQISIPRNIILAFLCISGAGLIMWKIPPVNIYVIFAFTALVALALYLFLSQAIKPLYGALIALGMGLIGFLHMSRMLDFMNFIIVMALLATIGLYIRQEKSS